jgi:hypothetical protein
LGGAGAQCFLEEAVPSSGTAILNDFNLRDAGREAKLLMRPLVVSDKVSNFPCILGAFCAQENALASTKTLRISAVWRENELNDDKQRVELLESSGMVPIEAA